MRFYVGTLRSSALVKPENVRSPSVFLWFEVFLPDKLPILRTAKARLIFRDMHIPFLSRISAQNFREARASSSLTLEGRRELRERERGSHTEAIEDRHEIQQLHHRANLKHYVKSDMGCDHLMEALMCVIAQSESMAIEDDCDPSVFEMEVAIDEIEPGEIAQDRIATTDRESFDGPC
jgi:hypothetical protein